MNCKIFLYIIFHLHLIICVSIIRFYYCRLFLITFIEYRDLPVTTWVCFFSVLV